MESPLDENYRNGILKVKVQFTNESGQNSPFVVGYRLLDKNDQQIAQSSTQVSGDQTEVEFTKKTIQEPLQWTAETPNLYTLVISLKRPNGDVIEATSCKVGFRTVEIKDKQLLVNGQPILVKGVNYLVVLRTDYRIMSFGRDTMSIPYAPVTIPSRNVSTNSVTNMVSTSSTKPI